LNYYPLVLPNHFIGFLKKFAEYTLTPLGVLIKHVLPKEISPPIITSAEYVFNVPELTHEQCIAKDAIVNKLGEFHISLLDGVTGSGKTEIYLEASVKAYESGKQTLILLPEISLTAQFRQRFEERFGKKPLIWHSQITPKQRNSIWHQAHQGAPCIMLGARSALLLPFSNLGLLVIDEEHDPSYKQDEVIIYHARDMAILRAKEEGVHAVLVSATPSLETIYNVKQRKFSHLILLDSSIVTSFMISSFFAKNFSNFDLTKEQYAAVVKELQSVTFTTPKGVKLDGLTALLSTAKYYGLTPNTSLYK
jgi:primosomal protein N' (replication factor Y)